MSGKSHIDEIRARLSWWRLLVRAGGNRKKAKHIAELAFWRGYLQDNAAWANRHYERFFTTEMNVDRSLYDGARILDVGCGPAGSLEWAHNATERVGIDPLADSYKEEFRTDLQAMTYVQSDAESMPFEDGHFDVVTSFNSLDHVDDVQAVLREIARVLRPGGTFVLLTEIHDEQRPTEPAIFSWELTDWLAGDFERIEEQHYEYADGPYKSLEARVPFDHEDPTPRAGVLAARFARRP